MKNTHEKIITNKEKYLTKAESVKIATIIEAVYKIKTKIKATGKDKFCITLEEEKIDPQKYSRLKKLLQAQKIEIYNATPKHNRRIREQQKNPKRKQEEEETNKQKEIALQKYYALLQVTTELAGA